MKLVGRFLRAQSIGLSIHRDDGTFALSNSLCFGLENIDEVHCGHGKTLSIMGGR